MISILQFFQVFLLTFIKKVQNVRGMQDISGNDSIKFQFIVTQAKKISFHFGFSELIIPIVEFSSIFERNLGEESDVIKKEIYKFEDRGGEQLALRPEFTAGVVRSFIQHGLSSAKFFSSGPLFRYDRPQKGRYRQFNQVNFESFGKDGFLEDAETIILANNFLNSLGIKGKFGLEVSSLGGPETLQKYKQALMDFFILNKQKLSALSVERLSKNPLRILDSKEIEDIELCKTAPSISQFYTLEEKENFAKTLAILTQFNIPFIVNEQIVRGLDYYTGVVFEFTTNLLGSQSAILGGGRYNNLVEDMGGKGTPAIGFAAGIERLAMLIEMPEAKEKTLFILPLKDEQILYSLKLADFFRSNHVKTIILTGGNVGKRLEKASKEPSINFAFVVGGEEEKTGNFRLKNLTESKEMEGDTNTILFHLC